MPENFIRYWRIFWLPGISFFIGRHNGKRSVWTETRKGIRYLDIWRD